MCAYHRLNSLQGRVSGLFKDEDTIRAFMKKRTLWKVRASQERWDIISLLEE